MGDPQAGAVLVALIFIVGVAALYVWSILWAYGDAAARGKSGLLVALFVALLSWPGGWLAWLVFRPNLRLPDQTPRGGY